MHFSLIGIYNDYEMERKNLSTSAANIRNKADILQVLCLVRNGMLYDKRRENLDLTDPLWEPKQTKKVAKNDTDIVYGDWNSSSFAWKISIHALFLAA